MMDEGLNSYQVLDNMKQLSKPIFVALFLDVENLIEQNI